MDRNLQPKRAKARGRGVCGFKSMFGVGPIFASTHSLNLKQWGGSCGLLLRTLKEHATSKHSPWVGVLLSPLLGRDIIPSWRSLVLTERPQRCEARSGIFLLNKDNNSCTAHCFMAGFSSEPPPVFVHLSSPDLQRVTLTAAQGHRRFHPLTKGPWYLSSIIWPCVYRFLSGSPALIIHTAESHSPERRPGWPDSGSSPTLWSYLSHSRTR